MRRLLIALTVGMILVLAPYPSVASDQPSADVQEPTWVMLADGVYQEVNAMGGSHIHLFGEGGVRWKIERYENYLRSLSEEEKSTEKALRIAEQLETLRGLLEELHEDATASVGGHSPDSLGELEEDEKRFGCATGPGGWCVDSEYASCGANTFFYYTMACHKWQEVTAYYTPRATSKIIEESCGAWWAGRGNAYVFRRMSRQGTPCEVFLYDEGETWDLQAYCPIVTTEPVCAYAASDVFYCYSCFKGGPAGDPPPKGALTSYYFSCVSENVEGCCESDAACDPLF